METQAQQAKKNNKILRAITITGIAVLGLLILGLFTGWFSFSTNNDETAERYGITFSLNKNEIRETFTNLGLAAKTAKESAQVLADMETAEGEILSIDSGNLSVSISTAKGQELVVLCNEASEILDSKKNPVEFGSLATSQSVRVSYRIKSDKKWVEKINILEENVD